MTLHPQLRILLAAALAAVAISAPTAQAHVAQPVAVSSGGPSDSPAMSADGSCVAFQSISSMGDGSDSNDAVDIYVVTITSDVEGVLSPAGTARISVAADGSMANNHSYEAAVSADCRYVAFTSLASNLVADDTNGVTDVFVHDRVTHATSRVSLRPDGTQSLVASSSPAISADGRFVVFDTAGASPSSGGRVFVHDRSAGQTAEILQPVGRSLRQPVISADGRFVAFNSYASTGLPGDYYNDGLWLHDRDGGTTQRIAAAPTPDLPLIDRPAIDGDGSTVAFTVSLLAPGNVFTWEVWLFDRPTGTTQRVSYQGSRGWTNQSGSTCAASPPCGASSRPALDAAGTQVGLSQFANAGSRTFDVWVDLRRFAAGLYLGHTVGNGTQLTANTREVSLSGDGTRAAFAATYDYSGELKVWIHTLDQHNNGMPDYWEESVGLGFGIDQGNIDSDGDGVNNIDEYRAGTHPLGFFRYYLAEGATSDFFSTTLAISGETPTLLTFQRADGSLATNLQSDYSYTLPLLVDVARVPGMERAEFSTMVESPHPLVVDRTMTWDQRRYGAHAETAQAKPRTTWYFAEGATHSGFDLFYLVQNPSTATATVAVTYLLPAPAPPLVKQYVVPPTSRFTIWVNKEHPLLAATDVSARIESTNDVPIFAERALYASRPGKLFDAGHAAFGIPVLSPEWYFAEGNTGELFDEFVTIANPGDTAADVDVTYLLPGGATVERMHHVAAASRYTIWVDHDDPRLADTAVSVVLCARNGVQIAAERVMWWPGPTVATWHESHVVAGATRAWKRWEIADGQADANTSMFVLIGNPTNTATTVRITLTRGWDRRMYDYPLPATSRLNVSLNVDFPSPPGTRFSIAVQSPTDIVVERATYWDADGEWWAAGTAALAVPRPIVFTSRDAFVAATGATHRTTFDSLAAGYQDLPFTLDGLTFSGLAMTAVLVREPPAPYPPTHSLEPVLGVGVNHFVITPPPGTRVIGVPGFPGGIVTIMDADGGGVSSAAEGYMGIESPADIVSVRFWSQRMATMSGFPKSWIINIEEILTTR